MQTVYINQLLAAHQMSNCNTSTTPMVEGLYLAFASKNYEPLLANVTAYKRFTGSIQ